MTKALEMMNRAEMLMIGQMTDAQYKAYMSMPREARFKMVAAMIGEAFCA
jgi:ABC-type tungstate transport system substrate-binding protein